MFFVLTSRLQKTPVKFYISCSKDTPDEHKKFVMSLKPTVTFTREGDSILQKYEFDIGYSVENTIKFGEEYEGVDKNEPKKFHNKVCLWQCALAKEINRHLVRPWPDLVYCL